MSVLWMLVIAYVFATILMVAMWYVQRATNDAGIVDVAWGTGVGLLAVFFAIVCVQGDLTRRIVVAILAMAWAIRLSGYVLVRVLTMPEDGRYETLKSKAGDQAQKKLFYFYQFQAFGCWFFALPMLLVCLNASSFGLLDVIGVALWIFAIGGESIADWQLSRFRNDPSNKGKVCRNGLWNYSRHPNYFFEWLHWWSYVLLAVTGPLGWLTIVAPMLMLFFILKVTGIPPTEAQAIKSRGDAYRDYQRTTSAFVPWFPKTESSHLTELTS